MINIPANTNGTIKTSPSTEATTPNIATKLQTTSPQQKVLVRSSADTVCIGQLGLQNNLEEFIEDDVFLLAEL